MENQCPRWRFRISTLMLLVVIAALSIALVIERHTSKQSEQRFRASAELARAETEVARAESARRLVMMQRAVDASQQALAKAQRTKAQTDANAPGQGATSKSRSQTTGETGR
jgi:hypothetical protein